MTTLRIATLLGCGFLLTALAVGCSQRHPGQTAGNGNCVTKLCQPDGTCGASYCGGTSSN